MTHSVTAGEPHPVPSDRVIGIDICGTGLKVALVSFTPAPARACASRGHATEDPERAMDRLAAVIHELCRGTARHDQGGAPASWTAPPASLRLAEPARVAPRGAGAWADGPAGPVHLETTRRASATEWRGARRRGAHALFVTLGSGVGGGVVMDGRAYRGATGLGAEIGHMSIRCDGPECPCGNRGCLELTWTPRHRTRARRTGLADGVRHFERCGPGPPAASRARQFFEAGRCLGVALAGAVNLMEPGHRDRRRGGGGRRRCSTGPRGAPDPLHGGASGASPCARRAGLQAGLVGAALLAMEAVAAS